MAWQRIHWAVVWVGLILALATSTHASVENGTSYEVWIKPEHENPDNTPQQPVRVTAGQTYAGEQDGVAVPAIRRNAVYKTCDHCSAIIRDRVIRVECSDVWGSVCQETNGGWKDEAWVRKHPNWQLLFDRSR